MMVTQPAPAGLNVWKIVAMVEGLMVVVLLVAVITVAVAGDDCPAPPPPPPATPPAPSCKLFPITPPTKQTLQGANLWGPVSSALSRADVLLRTTANTMGLSAVIVYQGEIIYNAQMGTGALAADGSSQNSTFDTSVWRLGSVTKAFTSTLLMKMVEDGNVTLETPITELIPGFSPLGYDPDDQVTLGRDACRTDFWRSS